MQGWMIALIVVACVIVLFAIAFITVSIAAFRAVLGRNDRATPEGFSERYAEEISWFDERKDDTETLDITAHDGLKLVATRLKHSDGTKRVAVLQHGLWASQLDMQPYAKFFFDKGYDVILPSARAHGKSEGKYIGMAWLDRFDFMRWINKTVELYGKDVKIAIMGCSMGGATVVACAGMDPPPQVACVIDDCGFSSQGDIYRANLDKVPLPKPFAILPLAVAVKLKCGYSVRDADFVPFAKNIKIPSLFIHGTADNVVPKEQGEKLFAACGSANKELFLVDGAEHVGSYAFDKDAYIEKLTEFVDRSIG